MMRRILVLTICLLVCNESCATTFHTNCKGFSVTLDPKSRAMYVDDGEQVTTFQIESLKKVEHHLVGVGTSAHNAHLMATFSETDAGDVTRWSIDGKETNWKCSGEAE